MFGGAANSWITNIYKKNCNFIVSSLKFQKKISFNTPIFFLQKLGCRILFPYSWLRVKFFRNSVDFSKFQHEISEKISSSTMNITDGTMRFELVGRGFYKEVFEKKKWWPLNENFVRLFAFFTRFEKKNYQGKLKIQKSQSRIECLRKTDLESAALWCFLPNE